MYCASSRGWDGDPGVASCSSALEYTLTQRNRTATALFKTVKTRTRLDESDVS